MQIGIATRDITPPPGAWQWGYNDRPGPATGTLDPLYAKAVVFRHDDHCAALVSMDLGRVPMDGPLQRIRERVKGVGVDYAFFAATHTHHAPIMERGDEAYALSIEAGIGDTILAAVDAAVPGHVSVGRTTFDIGHNRRHILPNGRCEMVWHNEAREPTAPLDREAVLLQFNDGYGALLGTMVHFACHPVIMGPSNLEYSADYIGELTRRVQEATSAPCIFLQGGCGDINPYLDKTSLDDGAVEAMRRVGAVCAEAVLDDLDTCQPLASDDDSVRWARQEIEVGTRWDFQDPAQRAVFVEAHGGPDGLFADVVESIPPDLTVPVNVLLINQRMAFLGFPGEMYVSHQLLLKQTIPGGVTLPCGYVDGFYAYFPPIHDALAGGYGGSNATFAGFGAGDRLALAAQLETVRLLGRWNAPCRPENFVIHDAPGQPPQ